jgi:hypothetical protein
MNIMKMGMPTGMTQNAADQRAENLEKSGQGSLKSDLQAFRVKICEREKSLEHG